MTGITKDELMQMAMEAGATKFYLATQSVKEQNYIVGQKFLERLFNAILDRAAVELEGAWHTAEAAESIRAIKINTGD